MFVCASNVFGDEFRFLGIIYNCVHGATYEAPTRRLMIRISTLGNSIENPEFTFHRAC